MPGDNPGGKPEGPEEGDAQFRKREEETMRELFRRVYYAIKIIFGLWRWDRDSGRVNRKDKP